MTNDKIFRILDANANRAREGLRVVEEYVRLCCDDKELTARLKELRHSVTGTVEGMSATRALLRARESDNDVGATAPLGSELSRSSVAHLVTANLRRAQEALRVLEEYSKLVSADSSAQFKRARFAAYTIEKDIRLRLEQEPKE